MLRKCNTYVNPKIKKSKKSKKTLQIHGNNAKTIELLPLFMGDIG